MRTMSLLRTVVFFCLLFMLALAEPVILHSTARAEYFEGIVRIKMSETGEGDAIDSSYFIKQDYIRMEIKRSNLSKPDNIMLFDYKQKKLYNIMPEMKQYLEMPLPSDETMAGLESGSGEASGSSKPVKTGKTETIHGYTCEQWIIKEGDEIEVELWMADGFPPVKGIGGNIPFGDMTSMPFKVITRLASGEELSRMEVIAVKKQKLDDSLFKPPSDYKKLSMPEGMSIPTGMQ